MTQPNHSRWRARRVIQAAAFAMPLVTLAATPALAEAAPDPTAYATVEPQSDPTPAVPDPFSSAVPTLPVNPATETSPAEDAQPDPAGSTEPAPLPLTEPDPSTPPSEVPSPAPSASESATPAPAVSETPMVEPSPPPATPVEQQAPTTVAADVTPQNAALAAAIQKRIIEDPAFRLEFIALVKNRIATDPAFAAQFVADVQRRIATEPFFAATWQAAMRANQDANVNFGATTWNGGTIRHPRGVAYYSQVIRWGDLVLGVMAELNIDPYYFPGIMAQIQQESAGNPGAVNGWDFNARMGYASMGLLQTIAPTYQAHARPGYRGTLTYVPIQGTSIRQQFASPWQTHPYTNLYAALNYVISRYGYTKFKSWNAGYNQGY